MGYLIFPYTIFHGIRIPLLACQGLLNLRVPRSGELDGKVVKSSPFNILSLAERDYNILNPSGGGRWVAGLSLARATKPLLMGA